MTTKNTPLTFHILILLFLLFALPKLSMSNTINPVEFYKGSTVKLVVGYGPGGGFDTIARTIAPWLEKKTGATVVVNNITGGGGIVALNQVVSAKPDGLTLMLANGQAATLGQLLDVEGVRYNLLDTPWIAGISTEPLVLMLSSKSPFRSIKDMQASNTLVKWSAGGKADNLADTAACLSEALGVNSRIIIGYKGAKEAVLAAMRGEVDAVITSESTALKVTKAETLQAIAVIDRKRANLFPGLPTIFELVDMNKELQWWVDFRANLTVLGRSMLTTPGTDKAKIDFLSRVFHEILEDPSFHREILAQKRSTKYSGPEELNTIVVNTLNLLSAEKKTEVRHVIIDKFYQ